MMIHRWDSQQRVKSFIQSKEGIKRWRMDET